MRGFFHRGDKFQPLLADDERPELPDFGDLWDKCPACTELIYAKELQHNYRVCPKCGHHFRLRARERIAMLTDDGLVRGMGRRDPAGRSARLRRRQRPVRSEAPLDTEQKRRAEALISGRGDGRRPPFALVVCDFDFLGASMGSVFGEKLARAAERCAELGIPLLTVNASGGARMHEGLFSLMQMAKTVAALSRLGRPVCPISRC